MGLYEHFPYSNYHELNLDWILSKVKELQDNIDKINSWKETFSASINQQIANLIEQVNTEFNQLKIDIENEFTTYRKETDDKFAAQQKDTQKKFDALTASVNATLVAYDSRIADIENKLDDIENNLPTLVHVTNPFTGQSDSIQNVINMLADTQRSGALTASAYDALTLTATAYDAKNVTASDYDFHGQSFIS